MEEMSLMTEGIRRQFKICLIGDGYVGKTSIRRQYLGSGFKASYLPTLGVDFAHTTVTYDDTRTQLVIWDIAGQPLFKSLRKRYYQGCSGIILVYSVVDRVTFDNASKWLVEAHGFIGELPPVIVAANKIDLRNTRPEREIVSPAEGKAFTQKFSEELDTEAVFIETSALTGENIDEAFMKLTEMMFQQTEKSRRAATAEATTSGETESSSAVSSSPDATATQLPDLDPVTSLVRDSEVLKQDEIGKQMAELLELRKELRNAEDELANAVSDYETKLLTLRNTVHVKKMMYEHLKRQISETRDEWAEAYDEYVETDEKKKKAIEERSQQIEHLRREIDKLGKRIRTRVSDLNLKKLAE
ncbi:MAG: GTP-binding protein [Candidatus Lokiarchaeota archaeon]|nr:GTP-binding protein [Candidatus Lokiarchaeota archaeon]